MVLRTRSLLLLAIVLAATLFGTNSVFAVDYTGDDTFSNGNDILLYGNAFSSSCSSNSTTTDAGTVTTDTGNIATAYNYFVKKGLTAIAASAIVGNMKQESTVNPLALNSKSGAYGLAQWLGSRLTLLKERSNYATMDVQLDYYWWELNHTETDALNVLKSYTGSNASQLAIQYGQVFERYGDGEEGSRGKYAADIYKQYGNGGATTGLAGGCSNTGAGDFVYYSQEDKQWNTAPYGSGTVGKDGCGPTSLAMIVATLYDQTVTPDTMAKLGAANGSYGPDGTIHEPLLQAAKQKYGITYTDLTGKSMNDLVAYVKSGGLIYMAGQGPAPFTSSGHIVVMRGVDDSGNIIIADPYNPPRGQSDVYSPSTIQAYKGHTYGITKS